MKRLLSSVDFWFFATVGTALALSLYNYDALLDWAWNAGMRK
jgi:hypothetical protein